MIGRNPDTSQICIDHFSLSRNHAKIKVAVGGSATLQDLESSNIFLSLEIKKIETVYFIFGIETI